MTATTVLLSFLATVLLGGVVAYAGALYWVHVVRPAPVRRRRSLASGGARTHHLA